MLRQPKNQYVHYKGVILSTSSPNNWYVPKCIGVTDKEDNALIGKELGSVCSDMIVASGSLSEIAAGNGLYKVVGTRIPSHTKLSRQWPRPTAGIERLIDPVEMILNEAPTGLVSDQKGRDNQPFHKLSNPILC